MTNRRVAVGDKLGDDRCTFTVLETDDPLAEYTDKLDQRFTGAQE